MRSETTNPSPTATAEKKALLEAFDTVLKTQAEQREAERAAAEARSRRGPSRALLLVCSLMILFTSAYLYVERPEWVFPAPPTPESTAVREASLRISLANAAQHLERYRERSGRFPATLEEAGAHGEGIDYRRTQAGYRLTAQAGELTISLDSSQPLSGFLGNSFEVISRRSR